jgi:hypothetical protein
LYAQLTIAGKDSSGDPLDGCTVLNCIKIVVVQCPTINDVVCKDSGHTSKTYKITNLPTGWQVSADVTKSGTTYPGVAWTTDNPITIDWGAKSGGNDVYPDGTYTVTLHYRDPSVPLTVFDCTSGTVKVIPKPPDFSIVQ